MLVRKASLSDLPQIMEIIQEAKDYLKSSGSKQWNTPDGYPNSETFEQDIKKDNCYIAEEDNLLYGVVAICAEPDESYESRPDLWSTASYYSIHRIAVGSKARHKGVAVLLVEYAKTLAKSRNISSLRGDTHRLNIPMQKLLLKSGFIYRGEFDLLHHDIDASRLAYELILEKRGV